MSRLELFSALLDRKAPKPRDVDLSKVYMVDSFQPKPKVSANPITYQDRFRKSWFNAEYDFSKLQFIEGGDSYLARAIDRKVNKIVSAGWGFVGNSDEPVKYIRRRFREMEFATNTPMVVLLSAIVRDLVRYRNCVIAKVRNGEASSGEFRHEYSGGRLTPVAGYFVLPLETLKFKQKMNGDLKKVLQRPKGASREKEYSPRDIIHIHIYKNPGFAVATPDLWPALDDVELLRRIEENVEELIDTNLFPLFQWKIGTDTMPERMTREGHLESDIVRNTVQHTPASGLFVTDHRHEITAVGSESKALRIDPYLAHFKTRLFTALGTSSIDMGESGGANRSTASTLSKAMLMDLEALVLHIEEFISFYMINELLIEGGYDPLDDDQVVKLKFGIIDKEEQRAMENHLVQTFVSNVRTIDEVRLGLGERPWGDEESQRSHHKLFKEPNDLIKAMVTGSAAGEALSRLPVSNVEPADLKKEQKYAEQVVKQSAATERQKIGQASKSGGPAGGARAASARARPSNQHGTRSTAKTTHDLTARLSLLFNDADEGKHISSWKQDVLARYTELNDSDLDILDVGRNMLWRIQ